MTMNTTGARIRLGGAVLLACALLAQAAWAQGGPIRIVVLPFYTEAGADVTGGGYEGRHYRRVSRYINNQLVRRGFEVVNPSAHEWTEQEYNRLRERAREDSPLAARELTRKFLVDVVYLVWFDVDTRVTAAGHCQARVRIAGEGYDSAARDIGAGLDRMFRWARRDCDDAVVEVETLAGDEVGRLLTAWSGRRTASRATTSVVSSTGAGGGSGQGGVIARNTAALGRSHQCPPGGGDALRTRGGVRQGARHGAGRDFAGVAFDVVEVDAAARSAAAHGADFDADFTGEASDGR